MGRTGFDEMNPGRFPIAINPALLWLFNSEKDGLLFRTDAPEQIMEKAAQGLFPFRPTSFPLPTNFLSDELG
jgi:hypothetical protein